LNKSSQIPSEGRKDISSSNLSDINIDLSINKVDGENSPKWFGNTQTIANEVSPINMLEINIDASPTEIMSSANITNDKPVKSKHRKHQSISILTDKVHEDVSCV
jgi:hypothetical protein